MFRKQLKPKSKVLWQNEDERHCLTDYCLREKRPPEPKPLQGQIVGNIYLHPEDVVGFIERAQSDQGLTITSWKKEEGWNQQKAEAAIDLLASLGLVTPRSRGSVCEWTPKARNERDELSVGICIMKIVNHNLSPPTPNIQPQINF